MLKTPSSPSSANKEPLASSSTASPTSVREKAKLFEAHPALPPLASPLHLKPPAAKLGAAPAVIRSTAMPPSNKGASSDHSKRLSKHQDLIMPQHTPPSALTTTPADSPSFAESSLSTQRSQSMKTLIRSPQPGVKGKLPLATTASFGSLLTATKSKGPAPTTARSPETYQQKRQAIEPVTLEEPSSQKGHTPVAHNPMSLRGRAQTSPTTLIPKPSVTTNVSPPIPVAVSSLHVLTPEQTVAAEKKELALLRQTLEAERQKLDAEKQILEQGKRDLQKRVATQKQMDEHIKEEYQKLATLLAEKKDVEKSIHTGHLQTLLDFIAKDDEEGIRLRLQHGFNPNQSDADGKTALHYAAKLNRANLVKLLLENAWKKADATAVDCSGSLPLHYAATHPNPVLVNLLLWDSDNELRCNPAKQDKFGRTASQYLDEHHPSFSQLDALFKKADYQLKNQAASLGQFIAADIANWTQGLKYRLQHLLTEPTLATCLLDDLIGVNRIKKEDIAKRIKKSVLFQPDKAPLEQQLEEAQQAWNALVSTAQKQLAEKKHEAAFTATSQTRRFRL